MCTHQGEEVGVAILKARPVGLAIGAGHVEDMPEVGAIGGCTRPSTSRRRGTWSPNFRGLGSDHGGVRNNKHRLSSVFIGCLSVTWPVEKGGAIGKKYLQFCNFSWNFEVATFSGLLKMTQKQQKCVESLTKLGHKVVNHKDYFLHIIWCFYEFVISVD